MRSAGRSLRNGGRMVLTAALVGAAFAGGRRWRQPAPTGATHPQPGDGAMGTDIHIEYHVQPRPRFGEQWGLQRHPELYRIISDGSDAHRDNLRAIQRHVTSLQAIPVQSDDERSPRWVNGYLPGLDTAALYAFVADRNPALYLEVGSGNSTRVVRRAIEDNGLRTRIVSLDPQPRAVCDDLCDEIIRRPLEDTDLAVFSRLRDGDVCFIDGSHCAFQNSDVTVTFLEVVPRLAPGVLLGIHDIYLPDDYPAEWSDRWYSEQYLLAAHLLGGAAGTRIVFPAWHVAKSEDFAGMMSELWEHPEFEGVERHGNAFWMMTSAPAQLA